MTRSQILAAVEKYIAGQGNQVDVGSKLPDILTSIVGNSAELSEVDDFEEFSETTAYSVGDIVRHNGKLYKFTSEHSAGEWDDDDVTGISVTSYLKGLIDALTPLAISSSDIAVSGGTALTSARKAAIEEAPELMYDGHNYAKMPLTGEIYAKVKAAFEDLSMTFGYAGNVYVNMMTCNDASDVMAIASLSALALVQDSSDAWWLVEVEE